MDVFLLAWLATPLLLLALSLGCGLLAAAAAERTGTPRGDAFPAILVVPVGFALLVVVSSLLTNWEATAPLAGVGPVAVAIAGVGVGRARVRGWLAGWRSAGGPLVAAALPGAALAAPIVLTGRPGITGYTKITDLGHQLAFIEYLRTDGRAPMPPEATTSSFDQVVAKLVDAYPGGTQSVVATVGDLTRVHITWLYQPVLAFVAAMLGVALFVALRRAIPSPGWRALAAGVAAQPTILYAYALAAGIKELSGAAAIALVVAVLAERRPMSWSVLVPAAIAVASGFAVFSVTILPWVGVVFLVFAAYELLAERRDRVATALRWAGIWGLAAVLTAPFVKDGVELLRATGATGPVGLGNLAAPVPAWSAVGPWITADHRFPLDRYGEPTATYALIALALALAAVGLVRAFAMRDRALVAMGIAGAVAMAYILRSSEVWVQLKAFCMTAPLTLALAFSGAAWVVGAVRSGTRLAPLRIPVALAGLWAGALIAGGVLYGNALQYRHTPMAPYDRLTELERLDEDFAGQGPALLPDFDEFAELILRGARASGLVDPWRGISYNRTARPGLQTDRDTDEFDQRFLQDYRLIIRRRDPTASRPPGNYRLAATYRWYEVWRQAGDPRLIEAHYPLQNRPAERTRRFCGRVQDSVDKAGPGASIRYAVAPPNVTAVVPVASTVPSTWTLDPSTGAIRAGAPGRLQQGFALKNPGTYRVYLRGSVGRRVFVRIDGRLVGAPRWQESYQGRYEPLGTVTLRGRDHTLNIERPGGDLLPGTGNDASGTTTLLGPVVLEPVDEQAAMRTVPASRLRAVCRSDARMDWIEVVRRVPR
jgi:hypothetical protein